MTLNFGLRGDACAGQEKLTYALVTPGELTHKSNGWMLFISRTLKSNPGNWTLLLIKGVQCRCVAAQAGHRPVSKVFQSAEKKRGGGIVYISFA